MNQDETDNEAILRVQLNKFVNGSAATVLL